MARDRTASDLLVVHCAATPPSFNDLDIAEIHRWHILRGIYSTRGTLSGYHQFIKRDGTVEQGRDRDEMGAHALGWNDISAGICLAGGVAEDLETPASNYTDDQWNALRVCVKTWLDDYDFIVIGHNDIPGVTKACPSFRVLDWFEEEFQDQGANRVRLREYLKAREKSE